MDLFLCERLDFVVVWVWDSLLLSRPFSHFRRFSCSFSALCLSFSIRVIVLFSFLIFLLWPNDLKTVLVDDHSTYFDPFTTSHAIDRSGVRIKRSKVRSLDHEKYFANENVKWKRVSQKSITRIQTRLQKRRTLEHYERAGGITLVQGFHHPYSLVHPDLSVPGEVADHVTILHFL